MTHENIFDGIDDEEVWCSTPTNRFLAFASSQINSFSDKISEFNIQIGEKTISVRNYNTAAENGCESNQELKCKNNLIEEIKEIDISKQPQINESIKELIPLQKREDFSNRQDVVNKASLRHLKKYYLNIFKAQNSKIVRTRFCNTKSSEFMMAIKKTFKVEFDSIKAPKDLNYYLMGILKLRDISRMGCSDETKRYVVDFLDCWRNYSKIKFDRLFRSKNFQVLWKIYISKNPFSGNCESLIQNLEDF